MLAGGLAGPFCFSFVCPTPSLHTCIPTGAYMKDRFWFSFICLFVSVLVLLIFVFGEPM